MKYAILIIVTIVMLPQGAYAGWIKRADFGAEGRHRGTGCAAGNRGYFGLGHYNGTGINIVKKDWWEYDPATNAWSQKADFIGNNGNGDYGVLTFGIGDFAYITGGTFGDLNTYRFSPLTNSWDVVAVSPTNFSNTEGFVVGSKGYIVKGIQLYEFDTNTFQWTQKNNTSFSSSTWMGAMTIDDKGYVRTGSGFYEYKQLTDTWIARAYFPGLASAASMNISQDGKGYVICGYGNWLSDVNSETWEYTPLLNSWERLEDFPGNSRRFGSSFSIGNRSFVGIGTNGTNFNDFWEFDADLYLSTPYLDETSISIYPNPVVDHVTIQLEGYSNFEIELINMQGQLLRNASSTNGTYKLMRESLPSGTYLLRVMVEGSVLSTNEIILN